MEPMKYFLFSNNNSNNSDVILCILSVLLSESCHDAIDLSTSLMEELMYLFVDYFAVFFHPCFL